VESKAEEYRRRAKDAEQQAEQARDVAAKRSWGEVAEQWREMAIRAERHGW